MSSPPTLPIRLAPLPGESFISWMEACAHRCGIDLREQLVAVGLHRHRQPVADHTVLLRVREAESVAAVTGVPVHCLHAMTLRTYAGQAVELDERRRSVNRLRLWGAGRAGRFCPRCLGERAGRWYLRWRLPWAFACTRHRLVLPHACTRCGKQVRAGKISITHSAPGHLCASKEDGRAGRFCGADLTLTPALTLEPDHSILATQAWIDTLLDRVEAGQAGTAPTPRGVFTDLQQFGSWILRCAQPGDFLDLGADIEHASRESDEDGMFVPASSAVIAAALTRAAQLVRFPTSQAAARVAHLLLDRDTARLRKVVPTGVRDLLRDCSPESQHPIWRDMDSRMDTVDRLRYRSCTPTPRPPDPAAIAQHLHLQRAKHVPQLLWPGWTARLMPPTGVRSAAKLRGALAVAVLLPGFSQQRIPPLKALLNTGNETRVDIMLARFAGESGTGVLHALCAIADYLDEHGAPIDYQRRRALVGDDLLPAQVWDAICWSLAYRPGNLDATERRMRRYLYHKLTGNDPRQTTASALIAKQPPAHDIAAVPFRLTTGLAEALDEYATQYLNDKGINEPLVWEPPSDLAAGLRLPGRDLADIDMAAAHRMIRAHTPPAHIAATQSVSLEHLRFAFCQQPLDALPEPPDRPTRPLRNPRRAHPTRHRLTEDFLRDQHVTHRKPIRQIAAETGYSLIAVTASLHAHGLTQFRIDRTPDIDERWLRTEYLTHGRSLEDIAQQRGIRANDVGRRAQEYGIPLRPPKARKPPDAISDHCPAILLNAMQSYGGWQRLLRFREAMKHRTLAEAAAALGLAKQNLYPQISRLERELGQQLCTRPRAAGQHVAPTQFGQSVLDAIDSVSAHSTLATD
jgi:DNA-binding transcriptional LysR family regulator